MEALKKNHKKIISLKKAQKLIICVIIVFLFDFLLFPVPVLASDMAMGPELGDDIALTDDTGNSLDGDKELIFLNQLPANEDLGIKKVNHYVITAYNSEEGQTDSTPCITANNFNVCQHGIEDTVAANFLPFGAKIRIPELFGDKIFVVRDRMNPRYDNRIDVWMLNKSDAKLFGVKVAKVEILE